MLEFKGLGWGWGQGRMGPKTMWVTESKIYLGLQPQFLKLGKFHSAHLTNIVNNNIGCDDWWSWYILKIPLNTSIIHSWLWIRQKSTLVTHLNFYCWIGSCPDCSQFTVVSSVGHMLGSSINVINGPNFNCFYLG